MDDILAEHLPMVHSIVNGFYVPYGLERDDLVQAGMIGIWKALSKFKKHKGTEFSTYSYVSARNEILMLLRKHKKFQQEELPLFEEVHVQPYEMEKDVLNRLIKADLEADEKEIVRMLYEGYTQQEIAKVLDTTQPRICQRIRSLRVKGKRLWGNVT